MKGNLMIMLLIDQDNQQTVIKCNDTSILTNISSICFGNNCPVSAYSVTDLTSAVEAVMMYYQ